MTPEWQRYHASRRQASIDALTPILGDAPIQLEGERKDPPFLWDRAYRDALKAIRSIPEPRYFADLLDERLREGLRTAWRGQNGWRVQPEYLRDFRFLGLAEVGGVEAANDHERNHLTAFGIAVRRVVMEGC